MLTLSLKSIPNCFKNLKHNYLNILIFLCQVIRKHSSLLWFLLASHSPSLYHRWALILGHFYNWLRAPSSTNLDFLTLSPVIQIVIVILCMFIKNTNQWYVKLLYLILYFSILQCARRWEEGTEMLRPLSF